MIFALTFLVVVLCRCTLLVRPRLLCSASERHSLNRVHPYTVILVSCQSLCRYGLVSPLVYPVDLVINLCLCYHKLNVCCDCAHSLGDGDLRCIRFVLAPLNKTNHPDPGQHPRAENARNQLKQRPLESFSGT